jgi:uncharacterized membrane protein YdbT with pleckstrin-like domain
MQDMDRPDISFKTSRDAVNVLEQFYFYKQKAAELRSQSRLMIIASRCSILAALLGVLLSSVALRNELVFHPKRQVIDYFSTNVWLLLCLIITILAALLAYFLYIASASVRYLLGSKQSVLSLSAVQKAVFEKVESSDSLGTLKAEGELAFAVTELMISQVREIPELDDKMALHGAD